MATGPRTSRKRRRRQARSRPYLEHGSLTPNEPSDNRSIPSLDAQISCSMVSARDETHSEQVYSSSQAGLLTTYGTDASNVTHTAQSISEGQSASVSNPSTAGKYNSLDWLSDITIPLFHPSIRESHVFGFWSDETMHIIDSDSKKP